MRFSSLLATWLAACSQPYQGTCALLLPAFCLLFFMLLCFCYRFLLHQMWPALVDLKVQSIRMPMLWSYLSHA